MPCPRLRSIAHTLGGTFRVALLAAAAACGGTTEPPPAGAQRVLFVGNSLTYYNDLPALVSALADSGGGPPIATAQVTEAGYSLEDHLDDGRAAATIRQGGWTVVVLQQGPSALESSRQNLLATAPVLAREIRRVGARPALYAVWPTQDRPQDFARSAETYLLAARAVDGLLFPVGDAWRATWRRDPSLALYDADALHPSPEGSYLAALVIYGRLSGRPVAGLPARLRLADGPLFAIDAARALTLQSAAAEVLSAGG